MTRFNQGWKNVKHSIHGPPQAVAITPDGRLAFVSSPDEYNYKFNQQIKLDFIQVIDLEASPAKIVNRIHLGSHPQGLSVSPDGKMLLAATVDCLNQQLLHHLLS